MTPDLRCIATLPSVLQQPKRCVSLIAPLVSGVVGLSASFSSKADTLNI